MDIIHRSMQIIKSVSDPKIADYCSLRDLNNDTVHSDKFFVAEGIKVVLRLLKSPLRIKSVFCTPEFLAAHAELIYSRADKESIYTADISLMSQIVGYKLHSGIMAIAEEKAEASFEDFGSRVVAFNSIVNSENVGAIVRNAVAFGLNSLLFDAATSSPYLRRAVRVSLGNIFACSHRYSQNLVTDLSFLRQNFGYKIIAAEINVDAIAISGFAFPPKCVIIFGNEGKGIEQNILDLCDSVVKIPMNPESDSINVAASSAIFFHHISQYK